MTRTAATVRKLRAARPVVEVTTRVAVVTCACGLLPLDQVTHRTSGQAWQAAARHVALNPTKCNPRMTWERIPAALAAVLPEPDEAPQVAAFVAA